MDGYVSVEVAATSTGITSRTLRYWITSGKIPATQGKRGRLVRLDDVRQIANLTGRANGNPETPSTSAGNVAGNIAGNGQHLLDVLPESLMVLRDKWLMPLVHENGDLREQIGALTAELAQERERSAILAVELSLARTEAPVTPQDAPQHAPNHEMQEDRTRASSSDYAPSYAAPISFWQRVRAIIAG